MAQIDYTDTAVFPPFASKAAALQALADYDNEFKRNPYELLARLANTDWGSGGDVADGAAADISSLIGGGRLE